MLFICPHCGAIARDTTGVEVLEYGSTLICDECGGMAVITITKRPNTASRPTALSGLQDEGRALSAQRLKHNG